MPKHPLAEARRRERSGLRHRIEKLSAQAEYMLSRDSGADAATYARRQLDGGVMLIRGSKRFGLSRDELDRLVEVAADLPPAKAHIQRFQREEPADPPHC